MADQLFFFGAGSSARFGIPTMKDMVLQFKDELSKQSGKDIDEEVQLYVGVEDILRNDFNHVDLEAVFSVIDGIAGVLTPKEKRPRLPPRMITFLTSIIRSKRIILPFLRKL